MNYTVKVSVPAKRFYHVAVDAADEATALAAAVAQVQAGTVNGVPFTDDPSPNFAAAVAKRITHAVDRDV